MKFVNKAAYCFMILMAVGIFSATAQRKSADKPGAGNTRENNTAYIEALSQKIQGNYEEAAQMFEEILKTFPNDHASMYELAEIYAMQQELSLAIKWASKATELAPENDWYFIELANLYSENNEPDKAVVILEQLVKKSNNKLEYVEELIIAYIVAGEFDKAIGQLDVVETHLGVSEETVLQKYKIYKGIGKDKKANAEIERLIKLYPNETRYYSILAQSYKEMGLKKEALKTYNRILEVNPNDPYVHISLAEFYLQEGDLKKAQEELKIGFQNPDLDFQTKLQLVGLLVELSYDNAQISNQEITEMLKTITQAHPDEPAAWALYGEIMLREENYGEAQKALKKVVASDSTRYINWEMLLFADYGAEDFQMLANDASVVARLFPLQPLPFLFGGIANFQLKNYAKAIQMLERGKDFVYDNPKTLEEFYMLLGDSYHQLENNEKCFYYYEKILETNPTNSLVLNNYAYYLSLSGKDLTKAERMSYESLTLDANNPSNMDTYGWILYKMGRYDDAQLWIKKALEKDAENATLNEHYGDVLFKLGKTDEAMTYWKKARAGEGEVSEFLDKKINDKKLYE
ncbi:tetratricopeptide repeat protein [Bacteroidales bacterium OttesenSCG-928-J16]|nr:tetratricopeptide repeat protein [Bacteroidales bacterium OttesenSCG-928-J16]